MMRSVRSVLSIALIAAAAGCGQPAAVGGAQLDSTTVVGYNPGSLLDPGNPPSFNSYCQISPGDLTAMPIAQGGNQPTSCTISTATSGGGFPKGGIGQVVTNLNCTGPKGSFSCQMTMTAAPPSVEITGTYYKNGGPPGGQKLDPNACGAYMARAGQICQDRNNMCDPGETLCPQNGGNYCINLGNNFANCGACGNRCPSDEDCVNGQCRGEN